MPSRYLRRSSCLRYFRLTFGLTLELPSSCFRLTFDLQYLGLAFVLRIIPSPYASLFFFRPRLRLTSRPRASYKYRRLTFAFHLALPSSYLASSDLRLFFRPSFVSLSSYMSSRPPSVLPSRCDTSLVLRSLLPPISAAGLRPSGRSFRVRAQPPFDRRWRRCGPDGLRDERWLFRKHQ